MVSSTASSSILAGFLVRPVEKATNSSYYAKNVTEFFKDNSEKFFESRHINLGALWIITIVGAFVGSFMGYRIGVRIYANPQMEQTIIELKSVIKDLTTLRKSRDSIK